MLLVQGFSPYADSASWRCAFACDLQICQCTPSSQRDAALLDDREGTTKVDLEVPFVAQSKDCVLVARQTLKDRRLADVI